MKKYLVLLALVFALLAYIVNPSVPDGLEERWKYRLLGANFKVFDLVGVIYGLLAPGDISVNVMETVQAMLSLSYDHINLETWGPGVITTVDNFNGTKVYIHQPPITTEELVPGFVYMHAGGLAIGTAKCFDGIVKRISSNLNAVVINIDYDNTPKNVFPGPITQSFAAVKWFLLHAKDYGVDPHRVAVGGDSAGGYLSAAISQLVYDDNSLPDLKLQILIYPWTQCFDFNFPSYQKYTREFGKGEGFVSQKIMAVYCALHVWGTARPDLIERLMQNRHVAPSFKQSALYMQTFGHDLLPASYRNNPYYDGPSPINEGDEEFWNENKHVFLDPRFTPHFRKNMTGLPTAYVVTLGYDTLRDEGYLYAQQLKKSGVDVTLAHYEKGWHGVHFASPYIHFALGRKIQDDYLRFVKERL